MSQVQALLRQEVFQRAESLQQHHVSVCVLSVPVAVAPRRHPLPGRHGNRKSRPLPLPRLREVGEEEEPAPSLLANQEQRSVLLPRLLEDRFQTPAGDTEACWEM